jgi:hypothetical protein
VVVTGGKVDEIKWKTEERRNTAITIHPHAKQQRQQSETNNLPPPTFRELFDHEPSINPIFERFR